MSLSFHRPRRANRSWSTLPYPQVVAFVGILTVFLVVLAPVSEGAVGHTSAQERRCGTLTAHSARYADRGKVPCRLARHFIKHTLSTPPTSMGSPGQPSRGWQCGWNVYRLPHGNSARTGAVCSRGRSEVSADWKQHLRHCHDLSASSSASTKFTAHDVWAYSLGCHTASSWIATFFSVVNPSRESYIDETYGCDAVSGHDAGCVSASAAAGEVYVVLRPAKYGIGLRACRGITGPVAVWARAVPCQFANRFVQQVDTLTLYRHPKPYRHRGYRCSAHKSGVELYSRCVHGRRLIKFQTGP